VSFCMISAGKRPAAVCSLTKLDFCHALRAVRPPLAGLGDLSPRSWAWRGRYDVCWGAGLPIGGLDCGPQVVFPACRCHCDQFAQREVC